MPMERKPPAERQSLRELGADPNDSEYYTASEDEQPISNPQRRLVGVVPREEAEQLNEQMPMTTSGIPTISDLPDHVLELIFGWLPQEDVYGSMVRVCQRWGELVSARCPCTELTFRGSSAVITTERVCRLLATARHLQSLVLSRREDACEILSAVPGNRLLRLNCSYSKVCTKPLMTLFDRCPNISDLTMWKCTLFTNAPLASLGARMRSLRALYLHAVRGDMKIRVVEMLSGCRGLQEIRLSSIDWRNKPMSDDQDIAYIAGVFRDSLELLQVDAHSPSENTMAALARCRRLKTLRLTSAFNLTGRGLSNLAALPNLEALEVSRAKHVTRGRWRTFVCRTPWMGNLRCLRMLDGGDLSEALTRDLALCCPNLEHLDLAPFRVEGRGLRMLRRGCPKLQLQGESRGEKSYLW